MTTTTEQLAEALRRAYDFAQRISASPHDGGAATVEAMRTALARYDAERADAADDTRSNGPRR